MAPGRKAFVVLVTALALLAADASSASAVTTRSYTGAAYFVVARQKDDASKIRLAASMHGLTVGHDYFLVGTRRQCSNAAQTGGRVFRAKFAPDAGEDDIFLTGRVAARRPLRRMRSVLYYDVSDPTPGHELGCATRNKPANGTLARSCGRLGELLGCAAAAQADGSSTIHVVGSIHGLTPGTNYALIGSTKPCSEAHTNEAEVFRVNLKTDQDEDDLFGAKSVNAGAPLSQIRSVRLFTQPHREQRFCDDMKIAK
jgi:hypothetical protein